MSTTLQAVLSDADLSLVFQRSGCACVVLAPRDWTVLLVTDRYLQLLHQQRGAVADRTFFELWTEQAQVPHTQAGLLASLERALTSLWPADRFIPSIGLSQVGGVQGFLERTTPIVNAAGVATHIVHSLEGPFRLQSEELAAIRREFEADLRRRTADFADTNERLLRETAEYLKTEHELRLEIAERRRVELALRESEQGLATTLHSIGDAVIATDTKGCVRP